MGTIVECVKMHAGTIITCNGRKKITDEFFTNLIVSGKPYPGKIWLSSIHAVYHTFSKSHRGQNYFTHGRLVKD